MLQLDIQHHIFIATDASKRSRHDSGHEVSWKPEKGKGKGKGKCDFSDKDMKTKDGEPKCINYNIEGCPDAKAGQRCVRGWHLCFERGCRESHSAMNH